MPFKSLWKLGVVLFAVGSTYPTLSLAAARELAQDCLSNIKLTQIEGTDLEAAKIEGDLEGAWGVATPGAKPAMKLDKMMANSDCIQDILLVAEENAETKAAVVAKGYQLIASWTPDKSGFRNLGQVKMDESNRQGSVGLYSRKLPGNGYSGYVVNDLRMVATEENSQATAIDGFETIGMWDVTDLIPAKGAEGTSGKQMMSLQVKRACYRPTGSGWDKCRIIENPRIAILGSSKTSDNAMNAVERVYTKMTIDMNSNFQRNMNDYTAYLTNGESIDELNKLWVVNTFWKPNEERDRLRGGANSDYLWISEQMICKSGVATYNQGVDEKLYSTWTKKDSEKRTFDQVVHEFAHAIDRRNQLGSQINEIYAPLADTASPEIAAEIAAATAEIASNPQGVDVASVSNETLMDSALASDSEVSDSNEAGSKTIIDVNSTANEGLEGEYFAWDVQHAFGTPKRTAMNQRPEAKALIDKIFSANFDASNAFSCTDY